MVKFIAYTRLIRLPILVLIAFIQYAARYFIIKPMLDINGYALLTSDRNFALMVLATVLIAAGGYAINDYFDVKIDRVNKPKKVIVDKYIKRRVAMALHVVLSTLGLLVAGFVCWDAGMWKLTSLFLFAVFILWYYSTTLQHQAFAGNLAIALMAAFVPLIVGLLEIPLQNAAHPESVQQLGYSIFNIPAFWLLGLSAAIFLLTLIREITKDVIDLRGDRIFGSKTIPVRFGIKATKSILILLYALFGGLLTWVYFEFLSVHIGMKTVFSVSVLMVIFACILLFRAKTKPHFLYAANLNVILTIILVLSTYFIKVSIEEYFM